MYQDVNVFDIHGHVTPPSGVRDWLARLMAANSALPSPLSQGSAGGRKTRTSPDLSEEAFAAAALEHADFMSDRGIDVQLIGPRPFLVMGWMQPHLIPSWTRFTNDVIHKQVQLHPDRFIGAAALPQISGAESTRNCLDELNRCVTELGFRACYLTPDPAGQRTTAGLDQPYWYPVYERCQELGLPIIVHGSNCLDSRIAVLQNNYQLGFMFEQYLATQLFSRTDIFERFPGLKVVVCHCGGALERFIASDAHHRGQRDVSANLFFDTCAYDTDFLGAAIRQRGVAQCCFGSEAPGSGWAVREDTGRTSDDLVPVIDALPFLSESDKLALFHHNPARVLPAFAEVQEDVR